MLYVILTVAVVVLGFYAFYPPFREWLKGYRTMLVAVATGVVGAVQEADIAAIVKPEHVGYWMLGIAVVFAALRAVTSTPMGRK